MKTLLITALMLLSHNSFSQINPYVIKDNTEQNRSERIKAIEAYLVELSKAVQQIELKLTEQEKWQKNQSEQFLNFKKKEFNDLEQRLAQLKVRDLDVVEFEKIKEDFRSLKNDDIEKMRMEIRALGQTIRNLETILGASPK